MEVLNREDRGYREALLGWRLMIVIRRIMLLSIDGSGRVGMTGVRGSSDDRFWFIGVM